MMMLPPKETGAGAGGTGLWAPRYWALGHELVARRELFTRLHPKSINSCFLQSTIYIDVGGRLWKFEVGQSHKIPVTMEENGVSSLVFAASQSSLLGSVYLFNYFFAPSIAACSTFLVLSSASSQT